MSRVVVVGSFNVDHVWRAPRLPHPGETLAGGYSTGPGGKGFNQAVAARRAGADTVFLCSIGDDAGGALARSLADADGIDLRAAASAAILAAATKVASGPLASTAPRPHSTPSTISTGICPGTVSIWPSNTMCFSPEPMRPMALPALEGISSNPRAAMTSRRYCTASRSSWETLGIATSERRSSTSA